MSTRPSHNVIHRDLKPENIFLHSDGTPVVGDFGLCYIDEEGQRFTVLDEAVGPIYYIAPELEDGRAEKVRPNSDVYSLGKLLYWILAGKTFAREKHQEAAFDLRRTKQDPAWHIVYELLDRMIVADPAQRFNDAGEAVKALETMIRRIEMKAHAINREAPQPCSYCGIGFYRVVVEYARNTERRPGSIGAPEVSIQGSEDMLNQFGFQARGSHWLIAVCNHCGHVQMFRPDLGGKPDIWKVKKANG